MPQADLRQLRLANKQLFAETGMFMIADETHFGG